jgi:phenylacetate-coenzyme A ligase PaaK-like adenylate-forming protein
MGAKGMEPDVIRVLSGIAKLPFTSKDDLRDCCPFGLFSVPMKEVVGIHTFSGTAGKAVIGGHTVSDIVLRREVMTRCLSVSITDAGGVVQNATGTSSSPGAWGSTTGRAAPGHGRPHLRREHETADTEIINPETGEFGEFIITTLTGEASPSSGSGRGKSLASSIDLHMLDIEAEVERHKDAADLCFYREQVWHPQDDRERHREGDGGARR